MPAGLINIAVHGAQDLYLTGTPEITFFKIVYRRHTNFAMESIEVNFDDTFGFGKESNSVLPSIGDLIHKMYIKIKLPYVHLRGRKINNSLAKRFMEEAKNNYLIVQKFMKLNTTAYRKALEQYKVDNVEDSKDMIKVILEVFNPTVTVGVSNTTKSQPEKVVTIKNFHNLVALRKFDPTTVDLGLIAQRSIGTIYEQDKNLFLNLIESAIKDSETINNTYSELYVEAIKKYEDASDPAYKFAWIKRLGHGIIDYVDVYIGGEKIDRHYGEWIDIWYELAGNKNMSKSYDKMIGDRPDLTNFDRLPKYDYTLYIPMQFWFCKYNGLSLPLVAMQYNDVSIKLKLRKIHECCYIDEEVKDITIQDLFDRTDYYTDIDVNDQSTFTNGLKGSLYIDYIFLDGPERRKFAQVAHEYLIDQLEIQSDEHTEETISTVLGFNYCSKEIIWIAQKQSNLENLDQHTECKWWNYGINWNGKGNPILRTKMEFNGYTIIPEETGNYFNYVQPYSKHRNTPADGINVYSFSLRPEEHQPTGSCNFTRISQSRLTLKINPRVYKILDIKLLIQYIKNNYNEKKYDQFLKEIYDSSFDEEKFFLEEKIRNVEFNENDYYKIEKDKIYLKIYSLRMNVLRIIGGYGALAFV